jgi:hypothetical protein
VVAIAAVVVVLAAVVGAVALRQAGGGDEVPTGPPATVVEEEPDVVVFMNANATDPQIEAIRARLVDAPEAVDVTFVDHDQAYAEFRQLYGDDPALIESVRPELLPTSFRIVLVDHDLAAATALLDELEGSPGVREIDTDPLVDPPEDVPNDEVLPRLVVDLPGWDGAEVVSTDVVEPAVGEDRFVVYQGDDGVLPLLTVLTTTGDYGLGPGGESVEVAGHSGRLGRVVGTTQQLGWVDRGETTVLTGYGLTTEELVAAADSLVRGPGTGWEVANPPDGMVERFQAGLPSWSSERAQEVELLAGDEQSASLYAQTGGEAAYWDAVTDVLFGAEDAEVVTVRDQPGILTGADGEYRIDWLERSGTVAMRMDLCCGFTRPQVDEVLANLVEVDVATWRALTGTDELDGTDPVEPTGEAPNCPVGQVVTDADEDGRPDTCAPSADREGDCVMLDRDGDGDRDDCLRVWTGSGSTEECADTDDTIPSPCETVPVAGEG